MPTPLELLESKAFWASRPLHATLELTHTCNLHCRYCYNPVERKGQTGGPRVLRAGRPLEFHEILGLLDQLATMGVLYLTLTGGEPMLHPRFWDIARAAKDRAFALRIFTNATLIGPDEALRFGDLCPNCIEISIHGATRATAEALNQVPGSFERFLKALELLRKSDLRVFLKCAVTRLVEGELEDMKALADRFRYPIYFDPILSPSDDGLDYPLAFQASDEGLRRLYGNPHLTMGISPFERHSGQAACGIGSSALHVDPYGNLMPCIQWREPLGNVREKPAREIWETAPALAELRRMSREVIKTFKTSCERYEFCQHCLALSKMRYGDPLHPDEQHLRLARIRREVWEKGATRKKEGSVAPPVLDKTR